jgi:hypothetical protein
MKKTKLIGLVGLVGLIGLTAVAQTSTNELTAPTEPPSGMPSIASQTIGWLTSFNTNMTTFQANRFSLWTAVLSESGGVAPIENEMGVSYDIWRPTANVTNGTSSAVFLEANERNTGVSGTIASFQGGAGFAYMIYDVRLSTAVDLGYNLEKLADQSRMYGEWNFKVQKALGDHWATGLGTYLQFPSGKNVQGFEAFLGAWF